MAVCAYCNAPLSRTHTKAGKRFVELKFCDNNKKCANGYRRARIKKRNSVAELAFGYGRCNGATYKKK